ncbi:ABC transporter permease [Streptomyces sp. NPDC003717]|uniref:ABC transporter permease n=1 Tax=Streptomyces sp. NPDC003717 TaxID=3154276 RepID=UPI0033B5C73D
MPTRPLMAQLVIVRHAAAAAVAEYRHLYTWRSWTFGWLGRMLSQVTFFTLVGRLLGSEASVHYLVVGNALMVCVIETMMVVPAGSRERAEGTLVALSSTPAPWGTVLFGRGLYAPAGGTLTSAVSLLVLAPLFGVRIPPGHMPLLLLLVVLTALSTYGFGLLLSALVIAFPGARNIVSNSATLLMTAVCGVQVPVDFWPAWVRAAAAVMPLTHCLTAVRALAAPHSTAPVAVPVVLALVTGACWHALAHLAASWVRRHERTTGSFGYA